MTERRARIPAFAQGPLRRFLDNHATAFEFFQLSIAGMTALQELPHYTEMFIKAGYRYRADLPEADAQKAYDEERTWLRQVADLAKQEESRGFPLLHAHTLVAVWGALEAAVEDMLVGILCNEPEVLKGPAFSRIRLPLADFENLEKDERMRLVLAEVSRDRGQGRSSQGVDHFEVVLGPFGLSGPVAEDLKKSFWTMHNLRNVIVHRFSVADRRLVEACPWLGLKLGDPVVITGEQMHEFHRALPIYTSILVRRLAARYGETVTHPELLLNPPAKTSSAETQ